ncbi:energy-coupling factor ABC transporter ATP-binding protein [Telmatocola sphagniphila]|uniref:Energy-coupling factor ABC transporter ATP-binding protein n=1 Tax=Telmatocola sphagniphila TaxID=1123043 RepID=A0A8E6BAD3_9BACT|nr:energy-coupling factor ABC transporter ATP-binding protein [Telmatocola sphagniphila]
MLSVEELEYRYPDGRVALHRVSFAIRQGECVGILGANGAGKTTLFLLLSGVLKARQGKVLVAGLNPFDLQDRKKLPTKLGIVFQDSDDQIFHATVEEDVAFGPLNQGLPIAEVQGRIQEAMKLAGIVGLEQRCPLKLSGGEKRKVALAGILAMRPEIILFDEPSVFLDARGRRSLVETICGLQQTKLIASHDLELIRASCNRILLMDEGRVIADGPAEDLLSNGELLRQHGVM